MTIAEYFAARFDRQYCRWTDNFDMDWWDVMTLPEFEHTHEMIGGDGGRYQFPDGSAIVELPGSNTGWIVE